MIKSIAVIVWLIGIMLCIGDREICGKCIFWPIRAAFTAAIEVGKP